MINILFFVFCLVTSSTSHRFDGMQSTLEEDLELERQLKLINKPPVKSIHTKFGYIVDCIDINKQPTFDHPLLKNHKLQRKPNFQKIGETSVQNSPTKPIFGLEKKQCPIGTVPIRRTTKDELIRAKLFFNDHILTQESPSTHRAQLTLATIPDSPYYGVSGTNSIYNPRVEKNQSSVSLMWIRKGPMDATNEIAVGWHVAPTLYNDNATHFFAIWTSDNFKKTGCYNLHCPGFVQTDDIDYLGKRLDNSSVYGGVMFELKLSILQDPVTKNWWLIMKNHTVGYFPAALFSNMATADQVGWAGITTTSPGTRSPPMGSGYFPDDNLTHACYFRNVAYQYESRIDYGPDVYLAKTFTTNPDCFGVKYQYESRIDYGPDIYLAKTFTTNPDCFGVKYYGDQGGQVGYFLQFGGPGGNCGN